MGEPPATSAGATTTIPEPLEDAVAAIEAREQAETEAESVETAAASAESRLEVLELTWAEQQVVPAVRDQALQMILGIVERHSESWPWIVSALDRGGARCREHPRREAAVKRLGRGPAGPSCTRCEEHRRQPHLRTGGGSCSGSSRSRSTRWPIDRCSDSLSPEIRNVGFGSAHSAPWAGGVLEAALDGGFDLSGPVEVGDSAGWSRASPSSGRGPAGTGGRPSAPAAARS